MDTHAHTHTHTHTHFSSPYISDSGSADVSASSIALKVLVVVGADSKGHATLKSSGCSLDIGHLDIKFHGGAR